MLDKAILIATYVFVGSGGEIQTMSQPLKDMRALSAIDCIHEQDKQNAEFVEFVKATGDEVDAQGRKLTKVTVQCYPVTAQEFAIFTSTFSLPDSN